MYTSTKAIVLSAIKYGDSSRILRCYTEEHGVQAYMINSVKSKRAVVKPSMLLPLTQLEITASHKGKGGLDRIKDVRVNHVYSNFVVDETRNALALFMAEVLSKSLKEEQGNSEKFSFVVESCHMLDELEKVPAHFHISFLVELSRYLGFYPDQASVEKGVYFDLMEGVFQIIRPLHPHYLTSETTAALKLLIHPESYTTQFGDAQVRLPKRIRKALLNELLAYYKVHVEGFGQLKSVEILEEIFA